MENNLVLNPKDIFSFAFSSAKKNFKYFFVVLLCFFLLELINPDKPGDSLFYLRSIIYIIAGAYVTVSLYSAVFKIVDGSQVSLKDFFTWPKNGFKMISTTIVSSLIVVPFFIVLVLLAGFFGIMGAMNGLLLVIGFIVALFLIGSLVYISIRLMFAKYYSLDTGTGPMDSIKESMRVSKGQVSKLIWLQFIMLGVGLLGILALFIGLLWAIPTIIVAQVLVYRTLAGKFSNSHDIISNTLPEVQPLELQANTLESSNEETIQN
jgi:uncharacterized membrane protein